MNGIGTLVNLLAVLVGGGFGLLIKGRLKVKYQQIISQTVGLAAIGVGLYEGIRTYFVISDKRLEMEGWLMVAFALLGGGLLGWALGMDKLLISWANRFKKSADKERKKEDERRKKLSAQVEKTNAKGETPPQVPLLDRLSIYEMPSTPSGSLFAHGFLAAALIICTNPMLFSGVYADCINGDSDVLLIKAVIDLVLCFALAFVYGAGVLYAAVPLGILEGGLTLLLLGIGESPTDKFSEFVFGLLTPAFMGQVAFIGAVLLVGAGVCLALDKKLKIANLFPALLVPAVYETVMTVVAKFTEK